MQTDPPRAGSRGPTDPSTGNAEDAIASRANGYVSLAALRREAAGLQRRAVLLTSATSQVERRLEELVRRGAAQSPTRNQEKIAELRAIGRDAVRLLEAAVTRREAIRRHIAQLERAAGLEYVGIEPPSPVPHRAPVALADEVPAPSIAPEPPAPEHLTAPQLHSPAALVEATTHQAPVLPPADDRSLPPIRRQELQRLQTRGGLLSAPLAAALRYGVMALMGVVLVALAALLTPLPELFGWQVFAVQSASMEPAIPVGSLIAVQPVPASSLAVGDVITFSEQNRPDVRVTHRIVQLETKDGQRVAVTKGDANNTTDSWNVPVSQAIGRVAFHLPLMGYALAMLGTAPVKLVALAIAGLMLALPSIRRRLAMRRSTEQTVSARRPDAPDVPYAVPAEPVLENSSGELPVVPVTLPQPGPTASSSVADTSRPPALGMTDDEDPDASFGALADEIDALLGRLSKDGVNAGKPAARR